MKNVFSDLTVVLAFLFTACNNPQPKRTTQVQAQAIDTSVSKPSSESVYQGMREMALNTSSGSLGLDLPAEKITVYGVIMDWGVKGKVVTTVAYQTGDASLYTSSGSGMLGGKDREDIRETAREYVRMAQGYLTKAKPAGEITLPGTDTIQFCFLTNKGTYIAREDLKNFENASTPWFGLISEANTLIEQLREAAGEGKHSN